MRICLISDIYSEGDSSSYMSSLSSGLDSLGHEVTVICSSLGKKTASAADTNVRVVVVNPDEKIQGLHLSSKVMPCSFRFCMDQLSYWHAFVRIADGRSVSAFDVVEVSQPLAGALLSAFTREIPTVMRVDDRKDMQDEGFDEQFQRLVVEYAYACVDLFSCASAEHKAYLQSDRAVDAEQVAINPLADPAELASRAVTIYETAIARFQVIKKPHIYKHGAQRLIKSTEGMICLYETMLYDLLYRVSYRFRVRHWWRKFASNPRGFARTVVQHLGFRS